MIFQNSQDNHPTERKIFLWRAIWHKKKIEEAAWKDSLFLFNDTFEAYWLNPLSTH